MKLLASCICISVILLSNLNAQTVESLDRIGQTPGGAGYYVDWHETTNRLIVGCGTSLWVYNMSDPENPEIMGKRSFLGLINQTAMYDDSTLLVAATFDGLYAVNLASDTLEILDHLHIDGPFVKRAAYDLSMVDDTLLVPYNGRISRLTYSNQTGFDYLDEIGPLTGLYCLDKRNDLVAIGQRGLFEGKVMVYEKGNYDTPLATWQDSTIKGINKLQFSDGNDSIIYVCGGSPNAGFDSYFHALEFSGGSIDVLDTYHISGLPIVAAANIQNMDSRNDTLYIATGCGVDINMGAPLTYVPVLDASGLPADTMDMIEYYNPGLWHFDVALMTGTPYMATSSEWLGVAINDISDAEPLDTLMMMETGGWTQSSLVRNDTLWVAHEGWGLAAYDLDSLMFSNGQNTESMLLHLYSQENHFFVSDFDFLNDTLILLGSGHIYNLKPWMQGASPDSVGKKSMSWTVALKSLQTNTGLRVIAGKEDPFTGHAAISVIDPFDQSDSICFEKTVYNTPKGFCVFDDIVFYGEKQDSASGQLFLKASMAYDDSLINLDSVLIHDSIYDINAIDVDGELVAVARSGRIHLFQWSDEMFTELTVYNDMNMNAIDLKLKNNYLYVAEKRKGVFVFDVNDPTNPEMVAEFEGRGAWNNMFGSESINVGDDGLIYLSDFNAGVIIIEAFDDTLTPFDEGNVSASQISVYPNPANDLFVVEIGDNQNNKDMCVVIYDVTGKEIQRKQVDKNTIPIQTNGWGKGIYVVSVEVNNHPVASGKIVVN